MTRLFIIAVMLLLLVQCKQSDTDRFRGMWKLDKVEGFDSASAQWLPHPRYIGMTGYILYDGLGHMGVHLTPKGYKDFNTSNTTDTLSADQLREQLNFYKNNFTYFSNYTVNDTSIAHHRLSATEPRAWNTTLVRDYQFEKDTLILTAHELLYGKHSRLKWVRMK